MANNGPPPPPRPPEKDELTLVYDEDKDAFPWEPAGRARHEASARQIPHPESLESQTGRRYRRCNQTPNTSGASGPPQGGRTDTASPAFGNEHGRESSVSEDHDDGVEIEEIDETVDDSYDGADTEPGSPGRHQSTMSPNSRSSLMEQASVSGDDTQYGLGLSRGDYEVIQQRGEKPRGDRDTAKAARVLVQKHVRSLMGEISDIESADEAEEIVDFDEAAYEPFESHIENALGRPLTQQDYEIPGCEDAGKLLGVQQNTNCYQFVQRIRTVERDGSSLVIHSALQAKDASGPKAGLLYGGTCRNWGERSFMTLCSMHQRVLPELVHGNLVLAVRLDSELEVELQRYFARAKYARHPCIYARVLVTEDGTSMTIGHSRRVAKWLRRYVDETAAVMHNENAREVFHRIEFFRRWGREYAEDRRRRSLETKEHVRSKLRVEVIETFCSVLEVRCNRHESDAELLSPPLFYVRYAEKASIRA